MALEAGEEGVLVEVDVHQGTDSNDHWEGQNEREAVIVEPEKVGHPELEKRCHIGGEHVRRSCGEAGEVDVVDGCCRVQDSVLVKKRRETAGEVEFDIEGVAAGSR